MREFPRIAVVGDWILAVCGALRLHVRGVALKVALHVLNTPAGILKHQIYVTPG
jgi:hypothetical protein